MRDSHATTDFDRWFDMFSPEGMIEVLKTRMVVEVELAAMASRLAADDDQAEMALILRRLKRNVKRGRATAHVTSDFHQALARAGHKGLLSPMAQILCQARLAQGIRAEHALPDIAAGGYASHRLLLDAIASRDADRARDEMGEHLEIAHGWERRINVIRSELALPAPERPRSRPSN